jgi:undecaprenyl-diphosphatase
MICFGLIGTAIYKILKNKINRPRPYKINQSIYLGGKILDQFSFPSGHTLHAVIFSLILIFYFPFFSEILLIFTLLIALSRVILGMHYPSDVFVGGLIGYIIFNLFIYYKNYENFILI